MQRSSAALLFATAVVCLLTACSAKSSPPGGSTASSAAARTTVSAPPSAPELVADAVDAYAAATSVHVTGSFSGAGVDGGALDIDISYGPDVAIGSLSTNGHQAEVRKIAGGTSYIRADAPFYAAIKLPARLIPAVAGKFVVLSSAAPSFSTFAKLLEKSAVFGGDVEANDDLTSQTVTGPVIVDGVRCLAIVVSDSGLYAAAAGDHLPVQLKFSATDQLDFTEYGTRVVVPTPAIGDTVRLPA